MSEDAQIRRDNLAALHLGPNDLVAKAGRSYSFWRDLIKSNKSFGEKLARSIEHDLSLPRGWLDRPPGTRVVLDYSPKAAEPTPPAAPDLAAAIPVVVRALGSLPSLQLGKVISELEGLDQAPERADEVITRIQEIIAKSARRKQQA